MTLNKKHKISKPIFIIGSGRNGSTVLFEAFAIHEDLAWFSNYDAKFNNIWLANIVPRIYSFNWARNLFRGEKKQFKQGGSRLNRYFPRPVESYEIWKKLVGEKFLDYLLDIEASSSEACKARRAVSRIVRFQGKSRFIAKFTGPARIEYLKSIFPDAIFINLIRDSRAVISSFLKVEFWRKLGGLSKPFWKNGLENGWEDEWEKHGWTPAALAAIQLRRLYETTENEQKKLDDGQFIQVNYEHFVSEPLKLLNQLFDKCDLPPSKQVQVYIEKQKQYVDMNKKYLDSFSDSDLKSINEILGSWLNKFGYV